MYEPVTSYGAISSLSVDHIMSDRPRYLRTKYLHALNIQNHVNKKKYVADIALLQKIEYTYSEIYKYLQKYTHRSKKASAFSKLFYAISTFNDFFRSDKDTHLFGDLPAMIEAFNSIFLPPRMTLTSELRNVATFYRFFLQSRNSNYNSTMNNNTPLDMDGLVSGDLENTLYNKSVSNSTINPVTYAPNFSNDGTFNGIIHNINNALEKVRHYDVLATALTDPQKRIYSFSDSTYLPVRTLVEKDSDSICNSASQMLISNLTFLKKVPEEMDKAILSNNSVLLSNIKTYEFSLKSYLDCINEYPNVIQSIQENISSKEFTKFDVDKDSVVSLADFNLDEIYAPLLQQKQLIKDLLDRYVRNSITKEFLALQFSQERVSVAQEGIRVFLNTLDAKIIQPFRSTISGLQKDMPALYLDLFRMAASLEKYFNAGNFTYHIKQLAIWKRPLVKIDTNVYEVKMTMNASGRFKGNNALGEIVQRSMQQDLDEHIRAYFEPTLVLIDDFSAKLRLYERDLSSALREGLTSYSKFLESTDLNDDFVRY